MFIKILKTWIARSILILALLCGILGGVDIQPAYAASLMVTNTSDSGPGSLRQAVASAVFGDAITFAPGLAGQTITLTSDLVINTKLTIDGSGLSPQVTISGGNVAHLEVSLLGDLTISSLVISNGYSSGNGGAIYSLGNIEISNSILENSHADGNGGAIALFGNAVGVISNSTIIQNHAGFDGGALVADGNGTLHLINSTVTQNQAGSDGGALATGGNGIIRVVNSTITQNQAAAGGGISIYNNSQVEIYNSTFAQNAAEDAAEIVVQSANSSLLLANTIFACAPENTGCYEFFSLPDEVNSLLGVGTLQDFGLAELADNGGPTQTMALLPVSPLIDAGDDLTCTGPLVNNLDQRGFSRSQGLHCDMGAYEYEQEGILYVDQDAGGSNNGLSWANAYTDLQDALAAASSGDEIWVAAGTYKPTTGTDRSISFVLKNGVEIYGGFAATETLLTERNPVTNITILSGDLGAAGDASDNSYHVVTSNNLDNTTIFDGFTVTAGNANFGDFYGGGGMYNEGNSTPQLRGVIFHANLAVIGAGMFNDMSSPVLTNLIFDGNISSGSGGGMFNYQSSPTLTDVIFNANNGTETSRGGAMVNDTNSSPHLTNVTFAGNRVTYTGGAMLNADSSNPILENVTFYDNSSMDRGGAIFNWASSPVLRNVTFSGNSAAVGGAIYNDNNSNPSIVNGILYGDPGGEIYNNSGVATVTYSIVQGDYPGTGNLDVDPLLGPLQDNGGFTQTMALGPGSPAIDAGDDVYCPEVDQRGLNRPQGTHCDIGAYEYEKDGILYVDKDAGGINNGLSWANAYTDIQDALTAASNGDEIWVAAGTYKPTPDTDRSISFVLKNGVELYGGFAGTETALSQRNHITNLTILSGDLGVQDDISDNSYHVVVGSYTDTSAVLDGFTVTAGNANETQTDTGGGMLNYRGSPTVANIIFTGNSAGRGGGMYNGGDIGAPIPNGSNPVLRNVTFSWNSAIDGGGMENQYGSSPTLVDVVFMYNTAIRSGGGMLNMDRCHANLMYASFIGNSAYAGGGMANFSSNSTLLNVLFNKNTAELGGGIFNSASSPSLTNVAFDDNTAISPGSEESRTNDSVDP